MQTKQKYPTCTYVPFEVRLLELFREYNLLEFDCKWIDPNTGKTKKITQNKDMLKVESL